MTNAVGAVTGLVSEYDLLTRKGQTAREVLIASVIAVTEGTDVYDVRQMLVERRTWRVPVRSGQLLAGIVGSSDMATLLTTDWVYQVCGQYPPTNARSVTPAPAAPSCGTPAPGTEEAHRI